jgi:hypothetical protein
MGKIIIFICFLGVFSAPNAQATVLPLAQSFSITAQNEAVFSKKAKSANWSKIGFTILLVIGIAFLLLGVVLFFLLARDGFDGGHLGYIPTVIAALILGLGLLFTVLSRKKLKKMQ